MYILASKLRLSKFRVPIGNESLNGGGKLLAVANESPSFDVNNISGDANVIELNRSRADIYTSAQRSWDTFSFNSTE